MSAERAVREALLRDVPQRRIAYFHIRNLPTRPERPSLAACEARAEEAFPRHPFLWEPKTLSGWRAVEAFRTYLDRARLSRHRRRRFLPVSRCPPDIISGHSWMDTRALRLVRRSRAARTGPDGRWRIGTCSARSRVRMNTPSGDHRPRSGSTTRRAPRSRSPSRCPCR